MKRQGCTPVKGSAALAAVALLLLELVGSSTTQEIKCGIPPVPVNARVKVSNEKLIAGTTATYTCDDGYELFGSATILCAPGGMWNGDLPFCGTNVAFRKPANQSTSVRGGSATNGNDGEKTTEHDGKRCTETQREASPWWQVDLLRHYPIKVVRVTTRGCCGHQPLKDLEIRVGNSSSDLQRNPLCAWFPGTIDEGITKTFTCARTVIGQHVFLQLVGVEGSLSLCEVEVFTTEEFSNDRCALQTTTDNSEIAVFSRTCYEFSSKGASFEDARNECTKNGGDLVHNFQPATATFLIQELNRRENQLKTKLIWIGAQKEAGITSRTWRWVNGDVVSKPTWGKDQPNNYNGEQNCVVLDGGRNWLWNDVGCNLDYLHSICQHSPSTCGSPDRQLNTTIIGKNYTIGSQISYQCPLGHALIGSINRTCSINGFWTGSAPSCKYIDCGPLDNIPNGNIILTENRSTYGGIALHSCEQNYTLIGNDKRQCGDNKKWSGETPKCLFDWCPDPPSVPGATVSVNGHQADSIATYECHSGFILFGQPYLKCTLGGSWSGIPPSCKYVDCGSPAHIDHGNFKLLNGTTTHGSVAQYICEEDHWMVGAETVTCNKDGKWFQDTPSCELITCVEPEESPGLYISGNDINVHSSIEYHCEPGHKMEGESILTCNNNGEWSGDAPSCIYIDCGKIPTLLYGTSEYINSTTYLDSIIRYSCSSSYRLVGPPMRKCQENGQWSESSPKCEEIRCPHPIRPKHSIVTVTNNDRTYGRTFIRTSDSSNIGTSTNKIGALAKYSCERGYVIVGESLLTCEDTGHWSGDAPNCKYVECGEPEGMAHGKVTLATNASYYGAAALYECEKNWQLDGVSRRLCQENGTWSSEAPACKEITCPDPSLFDPQQYIGLNVLISTRSVGGVAQYQCEKGFFMQGNNTRVCLAKGVWSGLQPHCQPVNCNHPGTIENGRVIVTNGSTHYGSAVEYHCVPHFQRVGPYLRKCMDNGVWSGDEPTCEIISNETQDSSNLAMSIGIGCGVVLFLLILLGIVYLRLRKAMPVKNTENIEGAERKEDQNAAVMSYASLHDGTNGIRGNHIYDHVQDNVYDAPYGDHLTDNHTYNQSQSGDSDTTYEPEPQTGYGPNAVVTINGVAVR